MASKAKYLQVRVNEDEKRLVFALAEDYGMEMSELVLRSLEHIRETRPPFVIKPQGKTFVPVGTTVQMAMEN